jgi:group II intron reverse transcriptase/maturase
MTEGNSDQTAGDQVQNWIDPSIGLERIREAAKRNSRERFTSLLHHATPRLLEESYRALKRDAAVGIDEMTWREYGEGEPQNLLDRLTDLHERVQSGRYRAQPSKRIYITKEDGRKRPIGIAALEDKIVQKAVVRILEQVYEEDFLNFSYGFRPGRGQHNALDAVWVGIGSRPISWVLDADLKSFFDKIDHEWMIKFLEHRIADRRMVRLIRKWLRAGVSEEGCWSKTTVGTPQGAVISPLLANVFLHYVLDLWVQQWRSRETDGNVIIVRYADDFVMGFQRKGEADAFCHALEERLAQFGQSLNEEKTRLIRFGRFAERDRASRGEGKPETFNFLGFTHICGKTRKNKAFTVLRIPIAKRQNRKLKQIREELFKRRHEPVPVQGKWLRSVVQGYFNYYAVPNSLRQLSAFRTIVTRDWVRALRRRSQKTRVTWARTERLLNTWVPQPKVVHPYPNQRLRV